MGTWENYKEGTPTPKKHVKIIIHGSADHYNDPETTDGAVDFDNFVNTIFNAHREELNKLFNSVVDGLEGNSVDKAFNFDSVEKQIK